MENINARYVEQPDGPMYVAVTSEHNPYRTTMGPEPIAAIRLEQQRNFVMFCAIMDMIINTWEFTIIGSPASLVFSCVSMVGYYGAKMYNYKLLISYTVYQFMLTLSKWVFMIYAMYTLFHKHEKYNESFWIVTSVSVPIQTYIFHTVLMFYRSLSRIVV